MAADQATKPAETAAMAAGWRTGIHPYRARTRLAPAARDAPPSPAAGAPRKTEKNGMVRTGARIKATSSASRKMPASPAQAPRLSPLAPQAARKSRLAPTTEETVLKEGKLLPRS